MKSLYALTLTSAMWLLATGAALADEARLKMPANPPASYVHECAGCHLPYSPALLPAESWNRIMSGLAQHYGVDASLSESQATEIRRWLTAHAAKSGKQFSPPAQDRITLSAWFTKKHDEIPQSTWAKASIKTPANCAACHPQAEKGLFDDDNVRIPK